MTVFWLSLVYKKTTFCATYDGLYPLCAQVELLCKGFVLDAVAESSLQESAVTLVVDVFIHQVTYLRICVLPHSRRTVAARVVLFL